MTVLVVVLFTAVAAAEPAARESLVVLADLQEVLD
jgi:hypothetical protein